MGANTFTTRQTLPNFCMVVAQSFPMRRRFIFKCPKSSSRHHLRAGGFITAVIQALPVLMTHPLKPIVHGVNLLWARIHLPCQDAIKVGK